MLYYFNGICKLVHMLKTIGIGTTLMLKLC